MNTTYIPYLNRMPYSPPLLSRPFEFRRTEHSRLIHYFKRLPSLSESTRGSSLFNKLDLCGLVVLLPVLMGLVLVVLDPTPRFPSWSESTRGSALFARVVI